MASSTTIDVDEFDTIDTKDGGADLFSFQNIPHDSSTAEKGETHQFTNFPHSAADSDDESSDQAKLLDEEKRAASFWTFAYYQQFFDVETKQVGQRIIGSMLPKPGRNYLVRQIRPNPDLYGPFWICTTLVFTTAIAGNLANYFSLAGKNYNWKYDFHKVTFAATAIFGYWWLIPLILFGILWWRGSQAKFTFLEIICVYGYSLAIYVPISVLWAIQVSWLQWTLVVVGAVLSGSVLLLTFWPTVSEDSKKIAFGVMLFIFVMHTALAAGFVLYFFHVPAASTATPIIPFINTTAISASTLNKESIKKLDSGPAKFTNLALQDTQKLKYNLSLPGLDSLRETKTLDKGKGEQTVNLQQTAEKGKQTETKESLVTGSKTFKNPAT